MEILITATYHSENCEWLCGDVAQLQKSSPMTWRRVRILADQIGLGRVPGDDDPWLDAADNHHRSVVGDIRPSPAVGNSRYEFAGSNACGQVRKIWRRVKLV